MPEPIELYLGFDEHFFRQEIRRDINHNREKLAERYRMFLKQNGEMINAILREPSAAASDSPFSSFCSVYDKLKELAKYEHTHPQMIRKPTEGLKITIDDLARKAGVSLVGDQRKYVGGRVALHLARLMFPEDYAERWNAYWEITKKPRNDHCEAFSSELIRYFATVPAEIRDFSERTEADKFRKVVGSEGHHVFLFWTLAPYVHLNLKERGLSPNESAKKVTDWALSGYDEKRKSFDYVLDYTYLINTPVDQLSPLGYDERMPTHLRTRLLSKVVAGKLVE